jgi:hypothetical protein
MRGVESRRPVRRLAPVLALAVGSVVLEASPAAALQCGVWRWPVKTLSDSGAQHVDYSPQRTSVRHLRTLDPPCSLGETNPRLRPVEYQKWRVRAKLDTAVTEDDHDYHVVIRVPRSAEDSSSSRTRAENGLSRSSAVTLAQAPNGWFDRR